MEVPRPVKLPVETIFKQVMKAVMMVILKTETLVLLIVSAHRKVQRPVLKGMYIGWMLVVSVVS